MFSMCSELTPRARIPDSRIPQFMQPWPHTFLSMWFDPLLSFMTIITNGDYKLKNISNVRTTMQCLPFWFWAKRQIFPFARASENNQQMISRVQSVQKNMKSLTKKFVDIVEKRPWSLWQNSSTNLCGYICTRNSNHLGTPPSTDATLARSLQTMQD